MAHDFKNLVSSLYFIYFKNNEIKDKIIFRKARIQLKLGGLKCRRTRGWEQKRSGGLAHGLFNFSLSTAFFAASASALALTAAISTSCESFAAFLAASNF